MPCYSYRHRSQTAPELSLRAWRLPSASSVPSSKQRRCFHLPFLLPNAIFQLHSLSWPPRAILSSSFLPFFLSSPLPLISSSLPLHLFSSSRLRRWTRTPPPPITAQLWSFYFSALPSLPSARPLPPLHPVPPTPRSVRLPRIGPFRPTIRVPRTGRSVPLSCLQKGTRAATPSKERSKCPCSVSPPTTDWAVFNSRLSLSLTLSKSHLGYFFSHRRLRSLRRPSLSLTLRASAIPLCLFRPAPDSIVYSSPLSPVGGSPLQKSGQRIQAPLCKTINHPRKPTIPRSHDPTIPRSLSHNLLFRSTRLPAPLLLLFS